MARPRLSPKARQVIKRIRGELRAYGIRLRLHKSAVIRADGDECSGYFDPGKKVVAVANKATEAELLGVLFHEYIHFLQWSHHLTGRRTRLARAWHNNVTTEALAAKGLSRRERYEAYRALLELERQAEVGMMRMLVDGGFIDEPTRVVMTKAAALYLYSHRLMYEKRRWFREGNGDLHEWLKDQRIWDLTPSSLRGLDGNRIPRALRRLLLRLF
jgi:hypothetical protein